VPVSETERKMKNTGVGVFKIGQADCGSKIYRKGKKKNGFRLHTLQNFVLLQQSA
jgi:hypothetical protein